MRNNAFSTPRPLFIALILITFHAECFAQGVDGQVQAARDHVFNAIANADSTELFTYLSPDFQLIRDQGQFMTREDVWSLVKMMKGRGVSIRYQVFDELLVREEGSAAWLVYRYRNEGNPNATTHYLEDAVFIKYGEDWKMELAHYSEIPNE